VKGTPEKTNPVDPSTKLISAPCLKEWMKEIGILELIGARSIGICKVRSKGGCKNLDNSYFSLS
jgi:hypothetical protein